MSETERKVQLAPEQAEEIIVELRNSGAYDGEVPEETDAQVEMATDFVYQAIDCRINENMRGEEITTTLNLADIHIEDGIWWQDADTPAGNDEYNSDSGQSEEVESDHNQEKNADKDTEALATFPIDNYDELRVPEIIEELDQLDSEGVEIVQAYEAKNKARKTILKYDDQANYAAERELEEGLDNAVEGDSDDNSRKLWTPEDEAQESSGGSLIDKSEEEDQLVRAKRLKDNLPVPEPLEGDLPKMPRDVTELTDEELMALRSEFGACLAYAYWQQALAQIDENAYKHLVDYHVAKAQAAIESKEEGKKKPETAIDRERKDALHSPEAQKWREKRKDAENEQITYKSLAKIYETYLDILSRQWSYRQSQLELGSE